MTDEKIDKVDAEEPVEVEETPVEETEDEAVDVEDAQTVATKDEAEPVDVEETDTVVEEPADIEGDEAAAAPAETEEAEPVDAEEESAEATETETSTESTEAPTEETAAPEAVEAEKVVTDIPGMDWYVLRVQSNKEDTVLENLEKRVKSAGLGHQIARVLVPTEKIGEMKGGKKRVTERKIYPGYVMVQMMMTDESWYLIRETPGIGDFVGGAPNTRPMPMPRNEVDKMLGEAEKVEEDAPKLDIRFREGEAVKITEGPFENFNGVVQEVIASKGLVKVEVTIFGRPTPVELEYWQVESI